MTAIKGTFLCVGVTAEAGVVTLGEGAMRDYYRTMGIIERRCSESRIAGERAAAYRRYFYAGVELAIPAWLQDNMLSVVTNYTGPDKDRMRMLAAMIHEGKNYGIDVDGDGPGPSGPKGGQPALLDPVKPKPKRPGGARAKVPQVAHA
jgi:hypothetical protein